MHGFQRHCVTCVYWWYDRSQNHLNESWSVQGFTVCSHSNAVKTTGLHPSAQMSNYANHINIPQNNPKSFRYKDIKYSVIIKLIILSFTKQCFIFIHCTEKKKTGGFQTSGITIRRGFKINFKKKITFIWLCQFVFL